jgi:hypothetical protein
MEVAEGGCAPVVVASTSSDKRHVRKIGMAISPDVEVKLYAERC